MLVYGCINSFVMCDILMKFTKGSSSQNYGSVGVEKRPRGDTISFDHASNSSAKFDFPRNNDPLSRVRSSFASEDVPDATSEKDLVGTLLFSSPWFILGMNFILGLVRIIWIGFGVAVLYDADTAIHLYLPG